MSGFLRSLKEGILSSGGPETRTVDDALAADLYDRAREQSDLIGIKPYKKNGGLQRGEGLLNALHDVQLTGTFRKKNISPASAFELVYDDDEELLQYRFAPGDEGIKRRLNSQLETYYPDSDIRAVEPEFLDAAPGQTIAVTRLRLRQNDYFLPIKHFKLDADHFDTDPYDSITSEMVGAPDRPDADVAVQLMIKPAISNATWDRRNWYHGIGRTVRRLKKSKSGFDWSEVGDGILEAVSGGQLEGVDSGETRDFTKHREEGNNNKAANIVAEQRGKKGYHVDIRIAAVSDSEAEAIARVQETAGMFRKFYDSSYEQGFAPDYLHSDIDTLLPAMAGREWTGTKQNITFATDTLTGAVHVPTTINTQEYAYTMSRAGRGVPPHTPRFPFETHGLDRSSPEDNKQVTMLENTSEGDPIWLGFGRKNGTEVGIYEEYLNAHGLFSGGTRMGKTTALVNFYRQVVNRDRGALVIVNGKENDEDRFIEEWPEDRPEEDFVFIDTGDEFDKRVRFNLLEIPTDAEPGSNTFESAVHTLADDWSATFAEAGGGSDNYWGALMERVTRTIIHGLAKTGRKCTPLDIAAACSSKSGLQKFEQWMDEDRIHFVREAAQRIAEKEDADLEPLAGRMSFLTMHAGLRNFMCARNPTASIQEFVEEGKVCVLRVDPNMGESETKFMLTPLVRRFYTAKKTLEDAPTFYLIWDEIDKGVSPQTNIHELLSIAGGHDFRIIMACQAPSNQLYDKLKQATQNQVDTAVSFGTGEEDARYIKSYHSKDVDADDLSDIGRYQFWLRTYYQTEDDEGRTYSYKVNAFPPIREVRQRVLGNDYQVDIEAMKQRSVDRYGDVPETAEQLKAESHFFAGQTTDASGTAAITKEHEHYAAKAVVDHAIATGQGEEGWITVEDSDETFERRLRVYLRTYPGTPLDDSTGRKVHDVLDSCWRVRSESRENGAAYRIRLPEPDDEDDENDGNAEERTDVLDEIMATGGTENAGKRGHRELLKDLYRQFTRMDLFVELPNQDAGNMPDAIGYLEYAMAEAAATAGFDPFDVADDEIAARFMAFEREYPLLDRLTNKQTVYIEAEKSTAEQPSQTVINAAQGYNEGRRTLFAAREDAAPTVYRSLTTPPMTATPDVSGAVRQFYTNGKLYIDGNNMQRGGGRVNKWIHDGEQYLLKDANGTVHARFNRSDDIFEDASAYPSLDEIDGTTRNITAPVIPERIFDGGIPEPGADGDFDVLAVPTADQARAGEDLQHYTEETAFTPLEELLDREAQPEPSLAEQQGAEKSVDIAELRRSR